MNINYKQFVNDYLATASWVTCDAGENTEFTNEAKEIAMRDCCQFIGAVLWEFGEKKATELLEVPGSDLGYLAAHCFFLNRNGHGSGFWDREKEFGDDSNKLSDISESFGSIDCYHIKGKKSKLTF